MSDIFENTSLEMTNVISYRAKIPQSRINQISKEIDDMINYNYASKTGPTVNATFGVDTNGAEPVLDMEILVPIDREIYVPEGYTFKPVFRLKDAIRIRHYGNPALLSNTCNELMQYISERKLNPVSAGYNVTVREPNSPSEIDDLIIDIYIGVNDNIL